MKGTDNMTVSRKRRHFRDDFKRKILADIQAGSLNIYNIKDDSGKVIKPLLIERWKDQLRTEGMQITTVAAPVVTRSNSTVLVTDSKSYSMDDLYREIGKLEMENRQLRTMAKSQYKPATKIASVQAQSNA